MINGSSPLQALFNMRFERGEEMSNNIAKLDSKFARLATMGSMVDEQMKVVILISSLAGRRQYYSTVVSVTTM